MKLDSSDSSEIKRLWKVVRTDSYDDVPGDIIMADEDTGECCLKVSGQDTPITLSFGPRGIRLVGRRR
jgi:hypothetical protein